MKESENSFQENLEQEYEKFEKSVTKPNILLLGNTGVGKSSMVNLIFGTDIAKSGVGKPVTQEISRYEFENIPVVLYDSVGYEIGEKYDQDLYIKNIIYFVSAEKEKPAKDQIHLVWYHIQASGHRVTDWDINIIKKIQSLNIPVAVVFTKCDLVSEAEIELLKNVVTICPAFEVTTSKIIEPLYLDLYKLIQWSADNLAEGLKEAFIKAQKINLEAKRASAKAIILQHTLANGTVGFSPIPFSDGPILLASQAGMVARILYVYDLNKFKNLSSTLVKTISIGTLISQSSKWIVGELFKLIPVVGTVAGGFITGGVAAVVTGAMGTSVSEICYTISKHVISGEEIELEDYLSNLTSIFKDLMTKNSKI